MPVFGQGPGSVLDIGDPIVGGTAGSVLFINSSDQLAEDNTNFFWDETANTNYLRLGSGTAGGEIRLLEGSGGGTSYTGFKAPATLAGNVLYTLPLVDGNSGEFLQTNGAGTLIWAASAPINASYIVLGVDGTLTDERILTGTANQITITDNGAGSTVVLSTPQDIATGSSPTFTGLTLSSLTQGSVLFAGAGGVISEDNSNLFWDDANNRLGIGETSPETFLHVTGAHVANRGLATFDAGTATNAYISLNSDTGNNTGIIFLEADSVIGVIEHPGADNIIAIGNTLGYALTITDAARDIGIPSKTPAGRVHIDTITAAKTGLIVRGSAAQSGNLTNWENSAGTALASVSANGTLNLTTLTASRLMQSDGSDDVVSVTDLTNWIAGTANQITVTDDSDGTVTLSTPQDIHTGASPTFSGLTLSSFTQGSVLFAGSSGVISQDNSNFYWDDTNNRLGIGDTSPETYLHVAGAHIANIGLFRVDGTGSNQAYMSLNSKTNFNSGIYLVESGTIKWTIEHAGNSSDELLGFGYVGGYAMTLNDTTGYVGMGQKFPDSRLHVTSTVTTDVVQIIRGAVSQTANLQEWQNSAGTALVLIDSDGDVGIGETSPNSTLDVDGSISMAIETVTAASDTLDSTNYTVLCDCTSNAITINLPAASSNNGKIYHIKKIDSSANAVTIDGNSSETIDDATTQVLNSQYDCLTIQCTGSQWFII